MLDSLHKLPARAGPNDAAPAGGARLLGRALVAASHHALALVGMGVAVAVLLGLSQPSLRSALEAHTLGWLQGRQESRQESRQEARADALPAEESHGAGELPQALVRTTATEPSLLSQEQAAVAAWIAKRYRIALEPMSRLVLEAWSIGPHAGLEPTLILAVAAVESAFNPFAQGSGGAKGLMQVVAHAHPDKFDALGGLRAAFDPVGNLRVGAQVLRQSISQAGSVEGGLMLYLKASGAAEQPGYAQRVMEEHQRFQQVADKSQRLQRSQSSHMATDPASDKATARAPDTRPAPAPPRGPLPADTARDSLLAQALPFGPAPIH